MNGAYSCFIRDITPYAYFSPEGGEEDNEIYVGFGLKKNDKLQRVYSGRKNTLSAASLAQGVCLAFRDPPVESGTGLVVTDFSGGRTVGPRVGLDPAAS